MQTIPSSSLDTIYPSPVQLMIASGKRKVARDKSNYNQSKLATIDFDSVGLENEFTLIVQRLHKH